MKLLICACAAVYGLVWAVRHPCRTCAVCGCAGALASCALCWLVIPDVFPCTARRVCGMRRCTIFRRILCS